MAVIVVDTSAFSTLGRTGDERLARWFKPENHLLMPLVVAGELRAGFALGNKSKENEAVLQKFLDSSNVSTVTLTDMTTKVFASIFEQLKKVGKPIGANDIWIAALAIEHDAQLLTLDEDFSRVPGLALAKL